MPVDWNSAYALVAMNPLPYPGLVCMSGSTRGPVPFILDDLGHLIMETRLSRRVRLPALSYPSTLRIPRTAESLARPPRRSAHLSDAAFR